MTIFDVVYEFRFAYLRGLIVTLKLCGLAWCIGILGGAALALAAESFPRSISVPVLTAGRVAEAIPILVLLFWLHYPIQAYFGVVIDPFVTTAALLATLNVLAVFGILRRAVLRVPIELIEIAQTCRVPRGRFFFRVKGPLALRAALGSLTSSQVNILQLSIFGGLISAEELFRVSQRINAEIYQPIEVYTGLAIFFLVICLPLNLLAEYFNRRFSRSQ